MLIRCLKIEIIQPSETTLNKNQINRYNSNQNIFQTIEGAEHAQINY